MKPIALSILALATTTLIGAEITASNKIDPSDRTFMIKAAQGGMAEVAESQAVTTRSPNEKINQFAVDMINDHHAANEKLKTLADSKGVILPAGPSMNQDRIRDKLKALQGTALDRTYLKQTLKDHEATVALFEDAAHNASDPDIRKFAAETLPTLRHHLNMARELNTQLAAR